MCAYPQQSTWLYKTIYQLLSDYPRLFTSFSLIITSFWVLTKNCLLIFVRIFGRCNFFCQLPQRRSFPKLFHWHIHNGWLGKLMRQVGLNKLDSRKTHVHILISFAALSSHSCIYCTSTGKTGITVSFRTCIHVSEKDANHQVFPIHVTSFQWNFWWNDYCFNWPMKTNNI